MLQKLTKLLILAPLLFIAMPLKADDLLEVFQQALVGDPVFQQASADRLSELQNVPIALSALLPFINASATSTYNVEDFNNRSVAGNKLSTVGVYKFHSDEYKVDLLQPLFDFAAWAQFQQAKISVKVADATYSDAVQDLMVRVAKAYFNVLNAEDNLRYTEAEKRAVYRQLDQVKQQYSVGLVAVTGVYQAQAQYDTILAQEIAAKNDIINRKEDLRAITGIYYEKLSNLKAFIPLVTPEPKNVEDWVATSLTHNWRLLAAAYVAEVAKEEIQVQQAGHYPVVGAVGRYSGIKTGKTPNGFQDNHTASVGVTLELPIYQGGFVVAKTRQAAFDYQAALDNAEAVSRQVVNATHQSYNNIVSGISKIEADRQAIVSNESSLRSTIEAFKVGTETMLDVLQAQQDLFNAQRIYSRDQYDYINSIFDLKRAAGTLSYADMCKINEWLTTQKTAYREIQPDIIDVPETSVEQALGNVPGVDQVNINTIDSSSKAGVNGNGGSNASSNSTAPKAGNDATQKSN